MPEEYDFNKTFQELIDNYVLPENKYIFEIQRDRYKLLVKTYVEMMSIHHAYLILLNMFIFTTFVTICLYRL